MAVRQIETPKEIAFERLNRLTQRIGRGSYRAGPLIPTLVFDFSTLTTTGFPPIDPQAKPADRSNPAMVVLTIAGPGVRLRG